MTATRTFLGLASLALLVGAMGCATTSKPAKSEVKKSTSPNDAQIAAIVATANQIDIDNGKLAKETSDNEEVKQFASRMIEDHGAVNAAALDLVNRLGVTPEESDTSRSLAKSARETRDRLSSLSGAAFDRAYVDNEVAYHEAVIQMLDQTLIPSAQNAELKALLVKARPTFVTHLEHARALQSSLGGATPSSLHGH
jgi:putative membrane protein